MQIIKSLVLTLLLMGTVNVFSQSTATRIDSFILKRMKEKNIPGLTLAIIENGEVIKKQTYGYSVIGHQVPAKIETIYELASVTKQFVAAGILLLVQDGLVDLDAPIRVYLDSLAPHWRGLTTRQLLSHTAGLAPMASEWQSLKENGWPKHVTRKMMWDAAAMDSIYDAAGTTFRYHNTGYFLAVLIIEKISGKDHRQFFEERIFSPLGMRNTFFEDQVKVTPNLAQGYTLRNNKIVKIWRVGQEDIGGGQGLYSDIDDMVLWNEALNNYKILRPDIQKEMFSEIQLNDGAKFRYGLGWWLPERNGIRYWYHNGVTGPEIIKLPEYGVDVIILSNLGQGDFDYVHHWGLAQEVVGQFFIEEFQHKPVSISTKIEALQKFCGSYQYAEGGDFKIQQKGEKLYLMEELGETELVLTSENTLSLVGDPVSFTFINLNLIQIKEETWSDDWATRIKK